MATSEAKSGGVSQLCEAGEFVLSARKMSAEKMLSGGSEERRRLCILGGAEVCLEGDVRVRERNIALLDATVGVLALSNCKHIEDG